MILVLLLTAIRQPPPVKVHSCFETSIDQVRLVKCSMSRDKTNPLSIQRLHQRWERQTIKLPFPRISGVLPPETLPIHALPFIVISRWKEHKKSMRKTTAPLTVKLQTYPETTAQPSVSHTTDKNLHSKSKNWSAPSFTLHTHPAQRQSKTPEGQTVICFMLMFIFYSINWSTLTSQQPPRNTISI